MPQLDARAYWSPKHGATDLDWEDACSYSEARGLLAVADGASSSYRAHDWANTMTEAFLSSPPRRLDTPSVRSWLEQLADNWSEPDTTDASPGPSNAAWYVEEVVRRGAFATFLGVMLQRRRAGFAWTAAAVGDTCLFHVRHDQLLAAFPIADPDTFDLTPALVATERRHRTAGLDQVQTTSGLARAGDTLLLATDAFAAWALRAATEDPRVWHILALLNVSAFTSLLIGLREHDAIEDDDMTLLQCRIA
jgi:hypothetical protein